MIELGELEQKHEELAKRGVRAIGISNDGLPTAKMTQMTFPHVTVVSDEQQSMARGFGVIHPQAAPDGSDTTAPVVLIVDASGVVRAVLRTDRFITRPPAAQILNAIDTTLQRSAE